MKSLGELVMEANIEEIALTSLRMQGLEEENERLKAQVADLRTIVAGLHDAIALKDDELEELEERNNNLITAIANLQRLYAHIDNAKQQVLG